MWRLVLQTGSPTGGAEKAHRVAKKRTENKKNKNRERQRKENYESIKN